LLNPEPRTLNPNTPPRASYLGVFLTFARNSLVRNMTFRANFVIESLSSVTWTLMNLGFYLLIFQYTNSIGAGTGWGQWEFFAFLATTMLVNSIVQAFFMPNCEDISELIRTGGLDFALLKPIDTQFLISLEKVDWSSLANFAAGLFLLSLSLFHLTSRPDQPLVITPLAVVLYVFYVLAGVAILYSLMIALSATSIWLGQNRSLYDFWFYITNFSRYPMEIYEGAWGTPLRLICTFVVPVLIVVNVPARIIARPLSPAGESVWPLAVFWPFRGGCFRRRCAATAAHRRRAGCAHRYGVVGIAHPTLLRLA
jgi:ABC-2 type transport system permease protein